MYVSMVFFIFYELGFVTQRFKTGHLNMINNKNMWATFLNTYTESIFQRIFHGSFTMPWLQKMGLFSSVVIFTVFPFLLFRQTRQKSWAQWQSTRGRGILPTSAARSWLTPVMCLSCGCEMDSSCPTPTPPTSKSIPPPLQATCR